jgi:hypothetical protein
VKSKKKLTVEGRYPLTSLDSGATRASRIEKDDAGIPPNHFTAEAETRRKIEDAGSRKTLKSLITKEIGSHQ